jgi:hypothetical protein
VTPAPPSSTSTAPQPGLLKAIIFLVEDLNGSPSCVRLRQHRLRTRATLIRSVGPLPVRRVSGCRHPATMRTLYLPGRTGWTPQGASRPFVLPLRGQERVPGPTPDAWTSTTTRSRGRRRVVSTREDSGWRGYRQLAQGRGRSHGLRQPGGNLADFAGRHQRTDEVTADARFGRPGNRGRNFGCSSERSQPGHGTTRCGHRLGDPRAPSGPIRAAPHQLAEQPPRHGRHDLPFESWRAATTSPMIASRTGLCHDQLAARGCATPRLPRTTSTARSRLPANLMLTAPCPSSICARRYDFHNATPVLCRAW